MRRVCLTDTLHTCSLPYKWAEFSAEEDIHMIENELNHHWLDSDFHESCCATEAGRFNLFRPETIMGTNQIIWGNIKFDLVNLNVVNQSFLLEFDLKLHNLLKIILIYIPVSDVDWTGP